MMLKKILLTLAMLLSVACVAENNVLEREVGEFDLKLGTAPTRSMAHGLVRPTTAGAFHGGLDLTHTSGWYIGQWSPSLGLSEGSQLEVNSYLGLARQPFDASLGYELGLIRYSFPQVSARDHNEYYAGLNLSGSRLGAALSNSLGRTDSTLFLDLGSFKPFGVGLRMKYANHALDEPHNLANGGSVRVFNDWSLNLSRPWLGILFDMSYTGSSLGGPQCGAYSGQNLRCDGLLMFRVERPLY
jgi:uncharacterized protein (TIGR02001 family)